MVRKEAGGLAAVRGAGGGAAAGKGSRTVGGLYRGQPAGRGLCTPERKGDAPEERLSGCRVQSEASAPVRGGGGATSGSRGPRQLPAWPELPAAPAVPGPALGARAPGWLPAWPGGRHGAGLPSRRPGPHPPASVGPGVNPEPAAREPPSSGTASALGVGVRPRAAGRAPSVACGTRALVAWQGGNWGQEQDTGSGRG